MAPDHRLVQRAIELLQAQARTTGRVVVGVAPGRVNLIGEHTDYSGGLVLPMAIDRGTVVVVRSASDPDFSYAVAGDVGESAWIDLSTMLRPPTADSRGSHGMEFGNWLSYVGGVLAQFQRHYGLRENLDISIASDVPIGSGLSSSAALESAIVVAVERFMGLSLSVTERARMGREAEHEFAGVPCGIMDQLASVMGVAGRALLIDCRTERVEPVAMPSAERARVVVMNTNVRHALADGEYAKRRSACERAAKILGVRMLREATPELIAVHREGLDDDAARACEHVVGENARVLAAVTALRADDLDEFGRLMVESHDSLRDVYRVSCDELDTLVAGARRVPGVFGARMTGAGFGGCAIAMCEPGALERLMRDVASAYAGKHGREATMFEVAAGAGAWAVIATPENGGIIR